MRSSTSEGVATTEPVDLYGGWPKTWGVVALGSEEHRACRLQFRVWEAVMRTRGCSRCGTKGGDPPGNHLYARITRADGTVGRISCGGGRPFPPREELERRLDLPGAFVICLRCERKRVWNGKGPPRWMHGLLIAEERERLLAEEEEDERHG